MSAFFLKGGEHLVLVILFTGVNCRLLTHSFQELISRFSIISLRDQIEPELQRAWSLLGA